MQVKRLTGIIRVCIVVGHVDIRCLSNVFIVIEGLCCNHIVIELIFGPSVSYELSLMHTDHIFSYLLTGLSLNMCGLNISKGCILGFIRFKMILDGPDVVVCDI